MGSLGREVEEKAYKNISQHVCLPTFYSEALRDTCQDLSVLARGTNVSKRGPGLSFLSTLPRQLRSYALQVPVRLR